MLILEVNTHSSVPIYEQIVKSVQRMVREGDLEPGTPLASVRQLAIDLEVNPNTVARAYRSLEKIGILETAGRKGTRIASGAPDRAQEALHDRVDEMANRLILEAAQLGVEPHQLVEVLVKRVQSQPSHGKKPGSQE